MTTSEELRNLSQAGFGYVHRPAYNGSVTETDMTPAELDLWDFLGGGGLAKLLDVVDAAEKWSKSNPPERARLDFALRGAVAEYELALRVTPEEAT